MTDMPRVFDTKVISNRQISPTGYELTIEKQDFKCEAGRLILLHGRSDTDDRSYTVASGERDEHVQVLYRLIPSGKLTPQLVQLKAGDPIRMSGPFGEFTVRDTNRPMVFVATGTGVAPARAYIRSYTNLNLTLLHGARINEDLFYRDEFERYTYYPCVTREETSGFHGRVTECLKELEWPANTQFYLCGANEMIFDARVLLDERGVAHDDIFTEAYYYKLHT